MFQNTIYKKNIKTLFKFENKMHPNVRYIFGFIVDMDSQTGVMRKKSDLTPTQGLYLHILIALIVDLLVNSSQ